MADDTERHRYADFGCSDAAMRSEVGRVREANEDVAYVDTRGMFFIVSDGIGGHAAGEVASGMAVEIVADVLRDNRAALERYAAAPSTPGRDAIRCLLEGAVRAANDAVIERASIADEERGMGATFDLVVVLGDEAFGIHVGDSRIYLVRDSIAVQTTLDHTFAEVMRRAGQLSAEEAATSRMRTVLCNAVGSPKITVDHIYLRLEPGDRLLLCTDGLYEYFDDEELGRRIATDAPECALDALVDDACARGGHDNISGIIVEVDPPAATIVESPVQAIDDDEPTVPMSVPF